MVRALCLSSISLKRFAPCIEIRKVTLDRLMYIMCNAKYLGQPLFTYMLGLGLGIGLGSGLGLGFRRSLDV